MTKTSICPDKHPVEGGLPGSNVTTPKDNAQGGNSVTAMSVAKDTWEKDCLSRMIQIFAFINPKCQSSFVLIAYKASPFFPRMLNHICPIYNKQYNK